MWGPQAMMLIGHGLLTTKNWEIRSQVTSWVVVTKCRCRRLFKEANESFFLLHQKVLTKAGLSERTDHTPVSHSGVYHLPTPIKSCCCSCGGNTLQESFYMCHWAKLYMCPKGRWVTQIYTHSIWFLSSPLLRFCKAMEQHRGKRREEEGNKKRCFIRSF